jgi:hypothetical protein
VPQGPPADTPPADTGGQVKVGEGAPAEPVDPVPPAGATGPAKPPAETPAAPTEVPPANGRFPLEVLGKNCFVAGTPLLTPTGATPIDRLRVGDLVLARSEFDPNGPVEAKVVEEIFVRTAPVVRVRVSGQVLETTREHPLYVEGEGWRCVSEIRPEYRLASHNGLSGTVEQIEERPGVATVYNIRVADYHTYFVGAPSWGFSVWAHNSRYEARQLPANERSNPANDEWGIYDTKNGDWVRSDGTGDPIRTTQPIAETTATKWNNGGELDPSAQPPSPTVGRKGNQLSEVTAEGMDSSGNPDFVQKTLDDVNANGQTVPAGSEWTSGRLVDNGDGTASLNVAWTQHLADLAQFVLGVEQLTGLKVTRIYGVAGEALDAADPPLFGNWIKQNRPDAPRFDDQKILSRLATLLGGSWKFSYTIDANGNVHVEFVRAQGT